MAHASWSRSPDWRWRPNGSACRGDRPRLASPEIVRHWHTSPLSLGPDRQFGWAETAVRLASGCSSSRSSSAGRRAGGRPCSRRSRVMAPGPAQFAAHPCPGLDGGHRIGQSASTEMSGSRSRARRRWMASPDMATIRWTGTGNPAASDCPTQQRARKFPPCHGREREGMQRGQNHCPGSIRPRSISC